MDFLKILKSFEEFIYEALLWMILLPKTLVMILVHPYRMTVYAGAELEKADGRYNDAMSPPLLLILCVVLAHAMDLVIRDQSFQFSSSLARTLLASEENLVMYRTIAFGVWALAGAAYSLLRTGTAINRENLRSPFYEQCYLVSPFALLLSISLSLSMKDDKHVAIANFLIFGGILWFWIAQTSYLRQKAKLPLWRSIFAATIILLTGSIVNAAVGYVLS